MKNKKFNPDEIIDFNIDYYAILGIEKNDLPSPIKENTSKIAQVLSTAYVRSAQLTHPDKPKGSEEAFKLVVRAHTILGDPILRKYYDSEGKERPRTVDDENTEYNIDWDVLGNYRAGTSADTVGMGLFMDICNKAEEFELIPAFYPQDEYHCYEWDWVIKDTDSKLSLSIVPDEEDVLRLTSGEDVNNALPFKIYLCIPRNFIFYHRDDEDKIVRSQKQIDVLKGQIKAVTYSDYNLIESTNLNKVIEYMNNKLKNSLKSFRDGTMIEEQTQKDLEADQSQWMNPNAIKENDILILRSILRAKSPITKYDPHASDFLERIKRR